jgi:hypothetical protein
MGGVMEKDTKNTWYYGYRTISTKLQKESVTKFCSGPYYSSVMKACKFLGNIETTQKR